MRHREKHIGLSKTEREKLIVARHHLRELEVVETAGKKHTKNMEELELEHSEKLNLYRKTGEEKYKAEAEKLQRDMKGQEKSWVSWMKRHKGLMVGGLATLALGGLGIGGFARVAPTVSNVIHHYYQGEIGKTKAEAEKVRAETNQLASAALYRGGLAAGAGAVKEGRTGGAEAYVGSTPFLHPLRVYEKRCTNKNQRIIRYLKETEVAKHFPSCINHAGDIDAVRLFRRLLARNTRQPTQVNRLKG